MFAIIELGNQQYRVEKDTIIETQLTGHESGKEFKVDKVLLVGNDGKTEIGKPYLTTAVKAVVMGDIKGKKVTGYFYRRRKSSQKTWGHRQKLQKIQILSIG